MAIGPSGRMAGWALAGALVLETDAAGPLEAWQHVPDDTALLVLSPDAADALEAHLAERPRLLWAVLPA